MPRILLIGQGACRTSLLILIEMSFSKAEILKTGSLHEGISHIHHDRFDLVLIDIDQSGPRTFETLKALSASHPAIRFAVMSISDGRDCISASLAGGMHGFVSKRQPDEDILVAMKEILSGGVYVPWSSARGNGGPVTSDQVLKLTPRQQQVLRLLSLGMSNKEIARALHIAESTTKIHTAMLMRALGVRNRTEAAFKAGKLLSAIEQSLDGPIWEPQQDHHFD
jgi:DNA-binding NarL/FixJ family response regulator